MVRLGSTFEQGTIVRRSNRIAERRRVTNLDQQEEIVGENQENELQNGPQPEQERNDDINHDIVSVHTSQTSYTEEETIITGDPGRIDGNDEDMTIAELRQRLIEERRRDDEERANLIRQNDDLREQNLRLQEQRPRSATRSRSRSTRSTSRQSQSNRGNDRRRDRMEAIEENSQEENNSQDQQKIRRAIQDLRTNRYKNPRELLRRTHHNLEREIEDPR
ncbi:pre-mRNA-splicing factor CWC22 homolog [Papaver somniferum]|uniref:pre-mRNA-splicing factor CWC22 homolog n=1 Tax=Papaver somniferum TaxID=3469 RepID=UPI000E6FEC22|nr:pre-mRNA-splicing factor CWC22 homolog [Papaver somniferum]